MEWDPCEIEKGREVVVLEGERFEERFEMRSCEGWSLVKEKVKLCDGWMPE